MATNCDYFLHWNTNTKEDDGALSHHRLLLRHRKEGHDVVFFFYFLDIEKKVTTTYCHRLLCSNNTIECQCIVVFFFSNTEKKATTTNCCFLFHFNTTIEKGNGSKLPLLSLLQQHHRRDNNTLLSTFSSLTQKTRQWQQVAIAIFASTPPEKRAMATSCHCFLRCNNTTKENDNTLPLSFSSLQHHHIKRWKHIVVVFFFSNI